MEITLTDAKNKNLKAWCSELFNKNNQTIRYVAKVIHLMKSSLPGVKYGVATSKSELREQNCVRLFYYLILKGIMTFLSQRIHSFC